MNYNRVKTYFHQFGVTKAIQLLAVHLTQKLFDPYLIPSYSQTGEDRIIEGILDSKPSGFYVDVGCNHPRLRSNTFELYKKGWRGVNIDANSELINSYKTARPRDISVCAAISDECRDATFTHFSESAVSSLSEGHVSTWKNNFDVAREQLVRTQTLGHILRKHNVPRVFDLLSIDVEGHDYEVLTSLDLNHYRPRLIVIEMHGLTLEELSSNVIYQHLASYDYRMMSYAVMNGYFVDSRSTLSQAGPNVRGQERAQAGGVG